MHLLAPDIPDSFPARDLLRRPAVQLLLAIICGVLAAAALEYRLAMVFAGAGAAATGAVWWMSSTTARRVVLIAAVACSSAGWTGYRAGHAPSDWLARGLHHEPMLLEVEGTVTNQPMTRRGSSGALADSGIYAPPSVRFRLRVDRVRSASGEWENASGTLYASVSGTDSIEAQAGDRVRGIGSASSLRAPGNPGAIDPRPAANQRGVAGSIRISSADLLEVLASGSTPAASLTRARAGMLERIGEAGQRTERADASGLLSALLLGDRDSRALRPLEESFTRTGVGHFLAISGLHVGMVLVGLAYLVRLTGDRPRAEMAVVVGAGILMLLFIPARPPVLRAVLIVMAFLVAQSRGRSHDRVSVLALVAAGLLIARPLDLFNPGYQLTFLVVAGLIVCVPPLRFRLFGERANRDELRGMQHFWRWLQDAIAVSICASAISTPLIAVHFGVFSPLAAPLSILLLPLVALVLALGYLALVVGSLVPAASEVLLDAAMWPAVWLADSVSWIDMLPGAAMYLPALSWPMTFSALVVIVWWMYPSLVSSGRRWVATAAVLVPILWVSLAGPGLPRSTALRIDALDVGDGTAMLLRRGREAILYDCGSRWFGIGEREIPRAVRALNSPRVRTVVISHPDTDHYSGLIDAARPLGVRRVLVSAHVMEQAAEQPDGAVAFLLDRLREMRIEVQTIGRGEVIQLADLGLEVLHPEPDDRFRRDNDASLVLRIRPTSLEDGPVVLLTGDIEREAMRLLEAREGASLRADIVEVPHHGSARAFAYPFVEGLGPRVLIQSTGPSRLLDERWDLVREGREWYTTASDGAITVIIRRDGTVQTRTFR